MSVMWELKYLLNGTSWWSLMGNVLLEIWWYFNNFHGTFPFNFSSLLRKFLREEKKFLLVAEKDSHFSLLMIHSLHFHPEAMVKSHKLLNSFFHRKISWFPILNIINSRPNLSSWLHFRFSQNPSRTTKDFYRFSFFKCMLNNYQRK